MRKWKVKLPGGHVFELESDDPGRALLERGHTSFALEEITPAPIVPVEAVAQEGKLTLSVQEAAEELGVCSKTVYNLIHRADFPVLRIGTRVRISRAGLAAWVQANTQKNIMEVS